MICIYCGKEIQKDEPFWYGRQLNGAIDQTRHDDCWWDDNRKTREQGA